MWNKLLLAVAINAVIVCSQPKTNQSTQPTLTTTTTTTTDTAATEVQMGSPKENESSPLSPDQYEYHTVNVSHDPGATNDEGTLTDPSLDIQLLGEHHTVNASSDSEETDGYGNLTETSLNIHLLDEPHNCTENIQNETLDVSCPDVTSLYTYAKKTIADIYHLRVGVPNVSGPLDLSQIISLNRTLRELDLRFANLTAFSYTKNSHQDFQKLLKLNLNGNPQFNTTSFVTLGYLPNLETLKLHGLKLDNRILSETFFKAAPNIERLDISNTGVRHLPTEVFENTPNLKILDASMNDLYVLKLEKQFVSRLIQLNVSRCKLENLEIENGGLQDKIIEVLDVSHNGLPELRPGLVSRLAPDAALHVDDNEWECSSCSLYHLWEYLKRRTKVSGGPKIKSCFNLSSLANCGWDECPSGCTCVEATKTVNCTAIGKSMIPGVGPSDTQVLILNDNQITSLKNINSSSWCQLREILIDHNRLSNFETSDLQGSCSCKYDNEEEDCFPQSLTKISAAYNHIKELQKNDCEFLQETKFLNLSHNEIKKTGATSCGHTIIKDLDVSYNRIERIEVKDLASLPLIENLILSNNQLTYFYRYQKNITPNLKYLDLSHNKIKRIEDRLSSNDSKLNKGWEFDPKVPFKLVELYLHSNQFGDSGGFLKVIDISKSLKKITLHDNPWVCDCEFCESFKEYDFTSIEAINKMVCQRPHNTPVIDFLMNCTCNTNIQMKEEKTTSEDNEVHNTKENNQTQNSLTNLIVIVVMAMILVGLFLWLCRFNTCVTKTLNGGQTHAELADETQGRKWDVFVVHSGEDRDFVNDHVITPLARKGYLVAWHENMFTPGNYIYENIEKAVKHSRRMLVVATGNFTQSHWGIKEIRRGRHEEVEVNGYKITALVTNSLPRELKTELYQIVQERTHVAFSDRDYIEKICDFLPRQDPRMVSSRNSTTSNDSLNEYIRQVLTARSSSEGNGESHPTVFQVFHDVQNDLVTINTEFENETIDDAARVAECITINRNRFKILPVNDESYKNNFINSRVSFRRKLSESSSVETFPRYTCLPPAPEDEDDEEDFSGPRVSRGISVRLSCRF